MVRTEPSRDPAVVVIHYRTVDHDGIRIFTTMLAENAPVELLLHGFTSRLCNMRDGLD